MPKKKNVPKDKNLCYVCQLDKDDEFFVFCDGDCGTGYHTYCFSGCTCCGKKASNFGRVDPVPEGDWFCKFCKGWFPNHGDQPVITYAYAFGSNEGKQLALNSLDVRIKTPTLIPDLKGVAVNDIQLGGWNSMLLTMAGNIYTCGDGENGKTGHKGVVHDHLKRFRLLEVTRAGIDGPFDQIYMGRDSMYARTSEGHIFNWGCGAEGKLANMCNNNKSAPSKISSFSQKKLFMGPILSVGWSHAVVIEEATGQMFSWGSNRNGQLGNDAYKPKWVPQLLNPTLDRHKELGLAMVTKTEKPCELLYDVLDVKCGKLHTLALERNGKVWSWGAGMNGQLGHGLDENVSTKPVFFQTRAKNSPQPKIINFLSGIQISHIASGADHCLALSRDTNALFTWGLNRFGQLGDGLLKARYLPNQIYLNSNQPTVSFRYIRFTPLKQRVTMTGQYSYIQLSQFLFFDNQGLVIAVQKITNPGGLNPPGEESDKVIDGIVSTKWFDAYSKPLIFDFGQSTKLASYQLCTANDSPERDPIEWTIEGSMDQSDWVMLDNHTDLNSVISEKRNNYTPKYPLATSTQNESTEIITGVFAGDNHSVVLTNTNVLYVWGCGKSGQLGSGSLMNYSRPKKLEIDFPDSKNSSEYNFRVRAGGNHCIAFWEHKARKAADFEKHWVKLEEERLLAKRRNIIVKNFPEMGLQDKNDRADYEELVKTIDEKLKQIGCKPPEKRKGPVKKGKGKKKQKTK